MAHLGLMLSRLALMVQAAVLDSQFLDPFSPFNDGGVSAEVGIGGGDVAEALVVAVVVIMVDESADLAFEISGQVIVFQKTRSAGFEANPRSCPGSEDVSGLHGHGLYVGIRARARRAPGR